jgi:hypothetical protein
MKSKFLAMVVGMVLLGVTTARATPITYAVSLFDGGATILIPSGTGVVAAAGSITTDGKLGALTISDIIGWDLLIVVGDNGSESSRFLFNDASGSNSFITVLHNLIATPLALTLTPITGTPFFQDAELRVSQEPILPNFVDFRSIPPELTTTCSPTCLVVSAVDPQLDFNPQLGESLNAVPLDGIIADGKALATAAVPGPIAGAGLPGLLAGFGVFGVWWKRRKQGSLAA